MRRWLLALALALLVAPFFLPTTASALPGADLLIFKSTTFFSSSDRGGNIIYSISMSNLGDDPANTFTITDQIPPNTTFVDATGGCCGATFTKPPVGGTGTVTINVPGTHNKGASTSFQLTLRIDCNVQPGSVITNTATISSPTPDPNPFNNLSSSPLFVSNNPPVGTCAGGTTPPSGPGSDVAVRISQPCVSCQCPTTEFSGQCASCAQRTSTLPLGLTVPSCAPCDSATVPLLLVFICQGNSLTDGTGVDGVNLACGNFYADVTVDICRLREPLVPAGVRFPAICNFPSLSDALSNPATAPGLLSHFGRATVIIEPDCQPADDQSADPSGAAPESTMQPGSLDNSVLSQDDKDALEAEANGLVRDANGNWVIPDTLCFPPFASLQTAQYQRNFPWIISQGCFLPAIAQFPSLQSSLVKCYTGCDALTLESYRIDVDNLGSNTTDIILEVIPGLSADVLPLPLDNPPVTDTTAVMAHVAQATAASPATAAATVQQVTSGATLPPGTRTLLIRGVPAGKSVSIPVISVVKLLTQRPSVAFVARVSSGGTDPTPRNNVEVVLDAVQVGSGSGQPARPVIAQVFQNPGAIQAVQQRPPRTPTPTPVPR